jgi:hypothetical protein
LFVEEVVEEVVVEEVFVVEVKSPLLCSLV